MARLLALAASTSVSSSFIWAVLPLLPTPSIEDHLESSSVYNSLVANSPAVILHYFILRPQALRRHPSLEPLQASDMIEWMRSELFLFSSSVHALPRGRSVKSQESVN